MKNVNFVVSPDNLDVLFLNKKNGIWKISEKQEFKGSLIVKDDVNVEFIRKVLLQLDIKNIEIGISLNTPFFFTNVIKAPDIEGNIKAALSMKIQTEFPLPLEKYFWSYEEIPSMDSQRTFLVFFYRRSFLEALNKAFAVNGILPVVVEPSILSILRYLREKFTLEVEKTYFIIVYYASVLTGFIYENGIIKNTFSELISEGVNINQSLEKFIQFTLQKFSVERIKREIGGLILISDEKLGIGGGFEVMYLCDILKISPVSVMSIGLNERVLRAPISGNEILLNTFNPVVEFLYLKISRYLNFWSALLFGASILAILTLYAYSFDLSLEKQDLKMSTLSVKTDVSKYKDDLKEIVLLTKKFDASQNIPSGIFQKVVNLDKMIQIKEIAIQGRSLTLSGIIGLKNIDNFKKAILSISQNSTVKEIKALEDNIEVEVVINF